MLKIRRPLGRLIFNMGIAIPGKTVFLIEMAPRLFALHCESFDVGLLLSEGTMEAVHIDYKQRSMRRLPMAYCSISHKIVQYSWSFCHNTDLSFENGSEYNHDDTQSSYPPGSFG